MLQVLGSKKAIGKLHVYNRTAHVLLCCCTPLTGSRPFRSLAYVAHARTCCSQCTLLHAPVCGCRVDVCCVQNNLVIFDRDGQKRAPLYHYLRRLG